MKREKFGSRLGFILFAVSSDTWIADHGNGVFGWKGIKKQRCVII